MKNRLSDEHRIDCFAQESIQACSSALELWRAWWKYSRKIEHKR